MQLNPIERSIALISDDDEFFRVALAAILRDRLKFSLVVETRSFDEAIDALSSRDGVRLALFDLAMPGLGNPVGLRIVREHFPTMRTSVVSGSRNRCDVLLALEAGVHGFVPKGLGPAELTRALEAICDGLIYVPAWLADRQEVGERQSYVPTAPDEVTKYLSERQQEILTLLVKGQSNKEMARTLDLSPGTIKFHLAALFRYLGVGNRVEAATIGARILSKNYNAPRKPRSDLADFNGGMRRS